MKTGLGTFGWRELDCCNVAIGSQHVVVFEAAREHAFETRHLLTCRSGDVFVTRFRDRCYQDFYSALVPGICWVHPSCDTLSASLSQLLLRDGEALGALRRALMAQSKPAVLTAFRVSADE